jgi:demethylmenaquinone methyltransferase/2-methoxy-6-polyprenyl-1,4-benzoquinol methylase
MTLFDNNAFFSAIATRYDLSNHLLSLNVDKRWRRKLVRCAGAERGKKILDVCTGTGDVAIRFAQNDEMGEIVGIDLSEEMLRIARRKALSNGFSRRIRLSQADAFNLPFDDGYFDVVTIAFGLRNIGHHAKGISEMMRVLKEGGRLLILEFSPPRGDLFGVCYRLYLNSVFPVVGGIITGSAKSYRLLSTSIAGFPMPEVIQGLMEREGLKEVRFKKLTGGIAYIHTGEKQGSM